MIKGNLVKKEKKFLELVPEDHPNRLRAEQTVEWL